MLKSKLLYSDFRSEQQLPIFGVFDGHGSEGHQVSAYLKHRIPKLLNKYMSKKTQKLSEFLKKLILKLDNDLKKTNID